MTKAAIVASSLRLLSLLYWATSTSVVDGGFYYFNPSSNSVVDVTTSSSRSFRGEINLNLFQKKNEFDKGSVKYSTFTGSSNHWRRCGWTAAPGDVFGTGRGVVSLGMSNVGGGLGDRPGGGGGGKGAGGGGGRRKPPPGGGGGLLGDDFFDPTQGPKKPNARHDKRADSRLPISYGQKPSPKNELEDDDLVDVPDEDENEDDDDDDEEYFEEDPLIQQSLEAGRAGGAEPSSSSIQLSSPQDLAALASSNPYMKVVQNLTPSELIGRFTSTAHPRVQSAVKQTILGLIGSLPSMAFETTTITTGERLASLMFQLQMTGYMFKNAEYRLSLSTSLLGGNNKTAGGVNGRKLLGGSVEEEEEEEGGGKEEDVFDPDSKIRGKIKVRYSGLTGLADSLGGGGEEENSSADDEGEEDEDEVVDVQEEGNDNEDEKESSSSSSTAYEVEVDAEAYASELRSQVKRLREELTSRQSEKEEAIKKDLLAYIRTLPSEQLRELTGTVSPDVLSAMKGLVQVVMAGIGEGQIQPDTVTEQSGEAMAQLCMWQLVVGYNLRELEVREEMKTYMLTGPKADIDDGGIILDD